jgi:signal transduction histidine kinase
MMVPLFSRGRTLGYLAFDNKFSGRPLTVLKEEVIMSMASQIAVALDNIRLYNDAIEAQRKAAQAENLASLGTLTAGFAHEIKNPMVALKTFTDILPRKYDDLEFRNRYLKVVPKEIQRVNGLVEDMLSLARTKKLNLVETDIKALLEDVVELCQEEALENGVKIIVTQGDWPAVLALGDSLKQVFINLCQNAIQAMNQGGTITISPHVDKRQHRLRIKVADTGPGMGEDIVAHVFEPFYTTRSAGTGLGLAITHKIVEDHEGTIDVKSVPNKGTTFTITLKLAR